MVNQQNAGNVLNFVFEQSKLLLLPTFFLLRNYQDFDFSRKLCVTPDCCNGFPFKFCAGNWRAGDHNLRLCGCSSIWPRWRQNQASAGSPQGAKKCFHYTYILKNICRVEKNFRKARRSGCEINAMWVAVLPISSRKRIQKRDEENQ